MGKKNDDENRQNRPLPVSQGTRSEETVPRDTTAEAESVETEPAEWRNSPEKQFELSKRFLALVTKEFGDWDQKAYDQYMKLLTNRKFVLEEEEIQERLARAVEEFRAGEAHLFLCICEPCCDQMDFDFSEATLAKLEETLGCRVSSTWCQFQCGNPSVATLRVGTACQMFAKFTDPQEWEAIATYAARCQKSGRFVEDKESIEAFLHDPKVNEN